MDTSKSVKIYSTSTCSYCKMAKEFFDENNIKYEDVNVMESETARDEMIKKTGQMGVPVIVVGDDVVVGFDKAKLSQLLGL